MAHVKLYGSSFQVAGAVKEKIFFGPKVLVKTRGYQIECENRLMSGEVGLEHTYSIHTYGEEKDIREEMVLLFHTLICLRTISAGSWLINSPLTESLNRSKSALRRSWQLPLA